MEGIYTKESIFLKGTMNGDFVKAMKDMTAYNMLKFNIAVKDFKREIFKEIKEKISNGI